MRDATAVRNPSADPSALPAPPGDPLCVQREIDLGDRLTSWISASEAIFLDVGERLRGVHGRVSTVRAGISRSTEIFATPEMAQMRAELSQSVELSREVSRLVLDRAEALDGLQHGMAEACSASSAVRLVFRMLDYVVLIARAQIGGMSSGQEDLVPFAQHVDELVATGEGVARHIEERMRSLAAAIEGTRALEAQSTASAGEATLIDGLAGLQDLLDVEQRISAEHRDEAQTAFTAVWKALGGVVMGLQAQDVVRQRFEHSSRNLHGLRSLLTDGRFGDDGEALAEALRLPAARRIACLEVAQLDDLAASYGARMGALAEDLAMIASQLDTCRSVLDELLPSDTQETGVAAVDAHALRLQAGFREGEAMRRRLGSSLDESMAATRSLIEMTAKLAELEHALRLAGFNAAVRAAHVEGGDETIGYIAGVIREQASAARNEADRVRRGIEGAVASTRRLSTQILPAVADAEASIETTLAAASERLSTADRACRDALADSATAATGLSAEIEQVRELMAAHEEGCEMMRALSAALAALVSGLPDAALPEAEAGRLDRFLCAPYTMEEERVVFRQALGAVPGAPPSPEIPPAPAPSATDDLDDILF